MFTLEWAFSTLSAYGSLISANTLVKGSFNGISWNKYSKSVSLERDCRYWELRLGSFIWMSNCYSCLALSRVGLENLLWCGALREFSISHLRVNELTKFINRLDTSRKTSGRKNFWLTRPHSVPIFVEQLQTDKPEVQICDPIMNKRYQLQCLFFKRKSFSQNLFTLGCWIWNGRGEYLSRSIKYLLGNEVGRILGKHFNSKIFCN